jgi:hypothetical protein
VAGISDVLGGESSKLFNGEWILSRFGLRQFAETEQEFVADYLASVGMAAARVPPLIGDRLIEKATIAVASGYLCCGSPEFNVQALLDHRLPFLTYVSLKVKHADITREQAEALAIAEDRDNLRKAIRAAMGYGSPNASAAKPAANKTNTSETPTSGQTSSDPSASPDSPTTKSTT